MTDPSSQVVPPARPTGRPVDAIDVVVLGAGLTGLSAALAVAAAGADVAVFATRPDPSTHEATALGILEASYPGGPGQIVERSGGGRATALWLAAAETLAATTGLLTTEQATIRTVARRSASRERIATDTGWLTDRGFAAAARELDGLLVMETGGHLTDPSDLVATVRKEAIAAGAAVYEDTGALAASRHTTGYQILTTEGKTTAATVIVTGGGQEGTPSFGPMARRRDTYGFAAVDDGSVSAAMGAAAVVQSLDGVVVRRFGNERIAVSCRRGVPAGTSPQRGAPMVAAMAERLVPGIASLEAQDAWTTTSHGTDDGIPVVWRADGMWFVAGHGADALIPAIAVGSHLGELIGGVRTQTVFASVLTRSRLPRRSAGRFGAFVTRRLAP